MSKHSQPFSVRVYGKSGSLLRVEERSDRSQAVSCGMMWQRPESSHRIEVVYHPAQGMDGQQASDRLVNLMVRQEQGWSFTSY